MFSSYFRIRLPMEEAVHRLRHWWPQPLVEDVTLDFGDPLDVALDGEEQWRGDALFVYSAGDWTVFEDLSGGFTLLPCGLWYDYAEMEELVMAGYDDDAAAAQLVVCRDGQVVRRFLADPQQPEQGENQGRLPQEETRPIDSWEGVAAFVDGDVLVYSESGRVLLFAFPEGLE